MNNKKRDRKIIFRVNEDEWKIIQKRVERCNVSTMSELFRQMMINGIYLEVDKNELEEIRRSVGSIANNVNQIALRINSTGRIYKTELDEIQEGVHQLWQQLQYIQFELQRLNPSNI